MLHADPAITRRRQRQQQQQQDEGSNSSSTGGVLVAEGSAAPSEAGLLSVFLQRVQIVEPTFREMLVVYRRKPAQVSPRVLTTRTSCF